MKKPKNCKCIPETRRGFIQAHLDIAEDFPDGAFMAYLESKGIDGYELEPFSDDHDCNRGRP